MPNLGFLEWKVWRKLGLNFGHWKYIMFLIWMPNLEIQIWGGGKLYNTTDFNSYQGQKRLVSIKKFSFFFSYRDWVFKQAVYTEDKKPCTKNKINFWKLCCILLYSAVLYQKIKFCKLGLWPKLSILWGEILKF